jgi:hypothetical protein
MDVSEIVRNAIIVGVLLFAIPFPLALLASAVAFAIGGFVAVEGLLGHTDEPEADQNGRPRPSG